MADMQAAMEEMRRKVEEAERREAAKREGIEASERAKLNDTYQKELEKDGGAKPAGSEKYTEGQSAHRYSAEERAQLEEMKKKNIEAAQSKRKIYLRVPYKEKKTAIGFGAFFDTARVRWAIAEDVALSLRDVEPFCHWLPDDAFPTIYRNNNNNNLNCSEKVQGADRQAFQRLSEAAKTATPQELRQQFGTETLNVSPDTAGEMWLEFKAAMSGDLKQGGANPEVLVVAEIDLILMPHGKELCDVIDPNLLPPVPKWKQSKKPRLPPPLPGGIPGGAPGGMPSNTPGHLLDVPGVPPPSLPPLPPPPPGGPLGGPPTEMGMAIQEPPMPEMLRQMQQDEMRAGAQMQPGPQTHGEMHGGIQTHNGARHDMHGGPPGPQHMHTVPQHMSPHQHDELPPPLPPGPPPLPPGWIEASDPRYGHRPYFFHRGTRETSWEFPTGEQQSQQSQPPKDVWGIGMPADMLREAYSIDRSAAVVE